MNVVSKEELKTSKSDGLTMEDLRRFVESNKNLEGATKVLCQRVDDVYFEGIEFKGSKTQGWKVLLVEGENFNSVKTLNNKMEEEILRREKGEEPHFDKIEDPETYKMELTDDLKEQFFPSWCITKDESFIYIHNHY